MWVLGSQTGNIAYDTQAPVRIDGAAELQVHSLYIPDNMILNGVNVLAVEVSELPKPLSRPLHPACYAC